MPLVQQGIVFMWNNDGNHRIYQRDKWFEIICCEWSQDIYLFLPMHVEEN